MRAVPMSRCMLTTTRNPKPATAGAKCVEHGSDIDDETAKLMAEHDVALVPTLAVVQALSDSAASAGLPESISARIGQMMQGQIDGLLLEMPASEWDWDRTSSVPIKRAGEWSWSCAPRSKPRWTHWFPLPGSTPTFSVSPTRSAPSKSASSPTSLHSAAIR